MCMPSQSCLVLHLLSRRMFVNVTAASDSASETKSSLGYGASAKKIQNSVEKQFEDKAMRSLQAAKAMQREKIASLVEILKMVRVSLLGRVQLHASFSARIVSFLFVSLLLRTMWRST